MRIISYLVLVTLTIVLSISHASGSTSKLKHKYIAQVIFTVGKVFRLSNKVKTELKKGGFLNEGEYILTKKHSIALLRVENEDKSVTTMIKINENSKMKIRINRAVPMAHLSLGSLVVKVMSLDKSSKNLKLKVQSRNAAIGVRGTEFFVYAKGIGHVTSMKEGTVEINGAGSSEPMMLGQGLTVTTNNKKQLTKPRKQKWQERINWEVDSKSETLAQPEGLLASIEATWNDYKNEQEYRYEMYKKDNEKKLNDWGKSNDKSRQQLFGN